ncbi:PREDICTED: phosphatidylinositol-glycan biosynthesis class X protein isoform X2 [Nelumbo nucifera]|nr:PREDICTED: phosphatidylinositol-glycan biosynthesis class X protein isoform X2 [Nelumbo nucifera]
METQYHVRVYIYSIISIQSFMLLAGTAAFVHSSSFSSEVGKCNLDSDYDNHPKRVSAPCSWKFLMESYFEKHDSLMDSDIQAFFVHELHPATCEVIQQNLNSLLRMSVLHRNLIGEGSHRHLFSFLKFNVLSEATFELPAHFCEAIIIERLPHGIFADPFELQHLIERGVFVDAAVFGDTNLELPSVLSNRSIVEVHVDIGNNFLATNKEGVEIKLELPLHARYPPLDGSGYSEVEINKPNLFVHCSVNEPLQQQDCLWLLIDESTQLKTSTIVWRIPSGNEKHVKVVSLVTFTVALLSTLLIVLTSIYSSHVNKY